MWLIKMVVLRVTVLVRARYDRFCIYWHLTNICRRHYVSEINICASKFGEDRIIRAFATWMQNITLLCVLKYVFSSFPSLYFIVLAIAYILNARTDFDG